MAATSTPEAARPDPVAVLDDPGRVGAILSPLRRRILGQLQRGPDSATGLARKLGLPRQKLNYHLRQLEGAGFLELAEARQRRGCVERTLRPTARAYLISSALLGDLAADPAAIRDRFSSSYQVAVAGRVVRDVTDLGRRAARAGQRLPTFTLETDVRFRTAADRAAFAEELAEAVAQLAARYHDASPGGRAFRFVLVGHPAVTDPKGAAEEREAGGTGDRKTSKPRRKSP